MTIPTRHAYFPAGKSLLLAPERLPADRQAPYGLIGIVIARFCAYFNVINASVENCTRNAFLRMVY